MFQELRVYVLAFGGLVSGGDGLVAAAAAAQTTAEAAATATAAATVSTGRAVVVVAAGGLGARDRDQRKGYALWNERIR